MQTQLSHFLNFKSQDKSLLTFRFKWFPKHQLMFTSDLAIVFFLSLYRMHVSKWSYFPLSSCKNSAFTDWNLFHYPEWTWPPENCSWLCLHSNEYFQSLSRVIWLRFSFCFALQKNIWLNPPPHPEPPPLINFFLPLSLQGLSEMATRCGSNLFPLPW